MSSFAPPTIGDKYSGFVPPVTGSQTTEVARDVFIPQIIVDPINIPEPAALPSTILSGDNPNDPTPPVETQLPAFKTAPPVLPLMAPDRNPQLADLNLTHLPEVQDSPPKGGNVTW